MMKRLKILGIVLIAVFALGAMASAPAFGAIEVLNKNHEKINSGLKASGHTATTTKLEILEGFAETKCPEVLYEGEQTSARLGVFHLHWHKCTTSLGGTCTGLGDETGLVLALGTAHLVEDKLTSEGTLGAAALILVEPTHYACKVGFVTTLINVSGEVLCLVSPLTLTLTGKIKCEQGAKVGDPGETVYWNEAGTKVEMGENGLLASENGGTAKMAAEVGEGEGELNQEAELMD